MRKVVIEPPPTCSQEFGPMTGCTKRTYPTHGAAMFALEKIQRAMEGRSGHRGLTGLHLCNACHAWHLTSSATPQVPARIPRRS